MINYVLNIFFMPFKKHDKNGLLFATWLMTLAFCLNLLSILHVVIGYLNLSPNYKGIYGAVFMLAMFYWVSNRLEDKFIRRMEFKVIKLPMVLYLIGPIYVLASTIILPLTFRFLKP